MGLTDILKDASGQEHIEVDVWVGEDGEEHILYSALIASGWALTYLSTNPRHWNYDEVQERMQEGEIVILRYGEDYLRMQLWFGVRDITRADMVLAFRRVAERPLKIALPKKG